VARRVREVQDFLGAPLALENPSTYVEFTRSTMDEADFLAALCAETGCALLLDVNNVFVSAYNHGTDPYAYMAKIPWDHVVQIHVAGHTNNGTHIVDTHVGPVIDPVWKLLGEAHRLGADASVLLEWDAEIPSFEQVHDEAKKAAKYLGKPAKRKAREGGSKKRGAHQGARP
jgi:uncharacterized protein (UPF0276 family)